MKKSELLSIFQSNTVELCVYRSNLYIITICCFMPFICHVHVLVCLAAVTLDYHIDEFHQLSTESTFIYKM